MKNNSASIAKHVFDFNQQIESSTPLMPDGVVGKIMTTYSDGEPVVSGIVFSDGSELSISPDGSMGWGDAGEWKSEDISFPSQP